MFKVAGSISVGIAFAGVFLPVLPTTPFVLLAFFLFRRSDLKYQTWLYHHPRLGPIVREYTSNNGLECKAKIKALLLLWISISVSVVYFIKNIYAQLITLLVATTVTIYILTRKTK